MRSRIGALYQNKWAILAFAALLGLLAVVPLSPVLDKYTMLMTFVAVNAMVTLGLCLLMGYTGQVSLGQTAFYGIGAYVSAILSKTYGVNPWLAMLIAAAASGLFAYVIGFPIFRLRGNYLAMATLGLVLVVYTLFREMGSLTGGPDGMSGIPHLSIGGLHFNTPATRYFLVWSFCLAALLLSQNIIRSRTGRALRAIHGSEAAAESVGIDLGRYKVKIFVLSAVYASIAGSLFVHTLRFVNPQPFGFMASVMIVTMAVVGGLASIWGALFGTAVVRILSNEVLLSFGSLDIIVYGLILMLVMIFVPQGLFVGLRDTFQRWRLKRARQEAPT
jgi:branched-chain amino acid transport system permease protein